MLAALKFVQGAIGKKDLVPELTHFRIEQGRITGYNGRIVLSSPIPIDIDCCPKALPLIRAIQACEETAQLHLTPAGKLAIRSGTFRTHVETIQEAFPKIGPEGVLVKLDGHLLPAVKKLFEFTSDDASRPQFNGILFNGHSAYATNNVILVECWLDYFFPYRICVPRYSLKELLRIGIEPDRMQITQNSASFLYPNGQWMRTQLIDLEWPDVVGMFERLPQTRALPPLGLWDALEKLERFVDDKQRVYFVDNAVASSRNNDATSIDVAGLAAGPIFNLPMLRSLADVAMSIDFSQYPAPVPFFGNNVRGVIVGMRET
jgi:DNA polymerase III sliding clamp (beta) subunit (PCNA family)